MSKKRWLNVLALIFIGISLSFVSYIRVFERFELLTYDLRFKIRPSIKYSSDIAFIEIDNATLNLLGRWPLDRSYHAVLMDILNRFGVRAIVFDMPFVEPDPFDDKLAAATERYANVYYSQTFKISKDIKDGLMQSERIDAPLLPKLKDISGTRHGHINVAVDVDGKKRRIPLVVKYQDQYYPHMALVMAGDYLKVDHANIKVKPKRFVRLGNREIPIDERGCLLINYVGRWAESFAHYSYFDILKSYTQRQNNQASFVNLNELKNKICFVGLTATGTDDAGPTPLESVYPAVGIEANVFNSIIEDHFIVRAGRTVNVIILMLLSALALFLTIKRRPLSSLVMTAVIIIGYIALAVSLFTYAGIWIDVFYPVGIVLLIYISVTLTKFLIEQKKRLLIEKELTVATKIQLSFLPQESPKKEGVDIAALMKTAKAVGGDLYDFVDFSDANLDLASRSVQTLSRGAGGESSGLTGIFIGDVSGKGMPASLYMALCIAQFRVSAKGNMSAGETLSDLNERLLAQARTGLFLTAFYMIYDSFHQVLSYSNGGHLPALFYQAKQDRVDLLTTQEGGLLGLIEDGGGFGQDRVSVSRGDIILLYTDGIVEARNAQGDEFGSQRLESALLRCKDLSAQEITQGIREEVLSFSGKTPQHDDLTIITLKIN